MGRRLGSEVRSTLLLVSLTQNFCLVHALVDAMQPAGNPPAEQAVVRNFQQVVNDEPYRLVGSHPFQAVEARQIHRAGKAAQRPLATQVEINIEIAERKL